MKKITSKVILLTMVIPLILIFIMGTTINMTSVMLDIPVTSVKIEGEKVVFVDVTSSNNTVKLNTIVTPNEATDKTITYSISSIEGEKEAIIDISKDGVVTPKSTGSVRIIATAVGGRQDSIQINFYSSQVSEVERITENLNLKVGNELTLTPGTDFKVYPEGANTNVTYYSTNNKVKVDRYTGKVMGLFSGEVTIIAKIEGIKYDENSNKFVNYVHEMEFKVNVDKADNKQDIFNFEGGTTSLEQSIYLNSKSVPFEYFGYNNLGKLSYSIDSNDSKYIQNVTFDYSNNNSGNINIVFKDNAPEKDYVFTIKAGGVELALLTIKKQKPSIKISTSKTTFNVSNTNIIFGSVVEGLENGYTIRYESSNPNILYVNTRNEECIAIAKKAGNTSIKARLYINGEEIAVSNEVNITVVDSYISIALIENSKTYGLENRFVFGKYNYNNDIERATYKLDLKVSNSEGNVSNIDYSKLIYTSSDPSIATVSSSGEINVLKDGIVNISVESKYNNQLNVNIKANFEITCKERGLNVYDYEDLVWANSHDYEIILMNDIKLADKINADNYKSYLASETHLMTTTADMAYYKDNGRAEDARIRYCFELVSNLYGNGYAIDGDNITQSIKKYNYSLFNGPLNLLALSYDNNSSGNAKIKAQDNIVFLVKKDGVSINNVELKGCSDNSIIESGQANLANLNNVGTVLEIVGDNINLNYSRVNNGRTVIRVYGKPHEDNDTLLKTNINDYKIETNISNCILSYGREFILKVGSNQIMRNDSVFNETLELPSDNISKYEHAAPSFKDANGNNYTLTSAKDEYFINNYLMTDINLKDSIFYGAGLFCVGFESQFAGLTLHGYDYGNYKFSNLGWRAIAGTSYPARIKMQGDVRFYDWKEVNRIDSTTLIEGDPNILETVGLDLNVSNLLKKYNSENPNNNVIYKYQGNDYINGAIVFYGGGKNYSWVDTSNVNSNFNDLETFDVPLTYFGSRTNLIYFAAGKENFKFMTYNDGGSINYASQQKALSDGSAYTWLMRK